MANSIPDGPTSDSDDRATLRAMFPYRRRPFLSNTYCTLVQIYSHLGNHSLCCEAGRPCPIALGLDPTTLNSLQAHRFQNSVINRSVPEASTTPDKERNGCAKANEETCGKLPGICDTKCETSSAHQQLMAGKDVGDNGRELVDTLRASTNQPCQIDGMEAKGKKISAGGELNQGSFNSTNDLESLLNMEKVLMDDIENLGSLDASFMDADYLNDFLNFDPHDISDLVKSTGDGGSHSAEVIRRENFGKIMKEKSFQKSSVISSSHATKDGGLEEDINENVASRKDNEVGAKMAFKDNLNEEVVLLKRKEEDTMRETCLISSYVHENNDNHTGNSQRCERVCYTREALLQLKEGVTIPEGILNTKHVIEAELHVAAQNNSDLEASHGYISKRKRRGPVSEEKREKKKKKQRKKRAEKNRELGVKRLKLQPILRQKTVQHCRHYLKGRCHEGEKCKFSHDVIPLTKTQPCCHFARQACMKGDVCPFDHQLSKYPCNNYVAHGFCSRGDSCMFSHKKPPNDHSGVTTRLRKTEARSLTPVDSLASTKQLVDDLLFSSRIHTPKGDKASLAIDSSSQPAPTPKGFSFLFGSSPLDNAARHKQAGLSQKNDCRVGVGSLSNQGEGITILGETSEETTLVTPTGTNTIRAGVSLLGSCTDKLKQTGFAQLSNQGFECGAQPRHNSSNINTSKFFSLGSSVSVLDDFSGKLKQSGSSQKYNDDLGAGAKPNKNASNMGPTNIFSFSAGDLLLDNSANAKQGSSSLGSDDIVRVRTLPKQGASSGLPSLTEIGKRFAEEFPAQGTDSLSFSPVKSLFDNASSQKQADSSRKIGAGGQHGQVASFVYPVLSGGLEHHTLSSYGETSSSAYGSGDHSSLPATLNCCSISAEDKETAGEVQKTNVKMQCQIASLVPSGRASDQVSNESVDNRTMSAQRALRSTLAFAGKYESGIKFKTPATATAVGTQVNKGGNSSVSEFKQKQSMKAADILDILYGGGSKYK